MKVHADFFEIAVTGKNIMVWHKMSSRLPFGQRLQQIKAH